MLKKEGLGSSGGPSKGKRRRLQKRFARAAGGGRKREFSREISQLGEWLKKERGCSHNVSKNELLKEFFALLVARAERCMVRAGLAEMRCRGKLG